MTPNNRARIALGALLAVVGIVPAEASIARAVSFEQKIQEADEIIVGRCTRSYSTLDPSGRWIVTISTFEVEDELKGSPGREVTVMTPGGTVGGIRQETVGMPQFKAGDEKLIFTAELNDRNRTVLYADQGTYDVVGSGDSRKIVPVASQLVLVDPQSGAIRSEREPARNLREFRTSVQRVLNREESPSQMSVINGRAHAPQEAQADLKARLLQFMNQNRIMLSMLAAGIALSTLALLKRR